MSLTHLDAGDLGDGVPLVGRFKWTGEKRRLWYGLRGELRVDARRAKEDKLPDRSAEIGCVDDVGLNLKVNGDEICGESGVSVDAADLGGAEDNVARALSSKEGLDFRLTGKIKLRTRADDEVCET